MSLKIEIFDEQGIVLDWIEISYDGDSTYASGNIRDWIRKNYKSVPDPNYDEFECVECGMVRDIEDSVRNEDKELVCDECAKNTEGD